MERREGADALVGQRAATGATTTATAWPARAGVHQVTVVGLSKDERRRLRGLRREVEELRAEDASKGIRIAALIEAHRALGRRWRRAEALGGVGWAGFVTLAAIELARLLLGA